MRTTRKHNWRGMTLVELLAAISIISIIAGILLPAVCRAYRASAARTAWLEMWQNTRLVMLAQEDLPATSMPYWLRPGCDVFREMYPTLRWGDVRWEQIRKWRESGLAMAGIYKRQNEQP